MKSDVPKSSTLEAVEPGAARCLVLNVREMGDSTSHQGEDLLLWPKLATVSLAYPEDVPWLLGFWGSPHSNPDSALADISLLRESARSPSLGESPSTQIPRYPLAPLVSGTSSHLGCSNLVLCSNLFTSPFHAATTCLFSLIFDIGYTTVSPISTSPSAHIAPKSSFLDSSVIISPIGFLGEFHSILRWGEEVMDPQSLCDVRSTSALSIAWPW